MIDEDTGRRRVLLKLSGEAFGGGALGVNPDVVSQIAREIAEAVDRVEIAIVVVIRSPGAPAPIHDQAITVSASRFMPQPFP